MSDLKILVVGTTKSGKTTIAKVIFDALSERGINAVIVDDSNDIDNQEINLKRLHKLVNEIKNIKIETVQCKRS